MPYVGDEFFPDAAEVEAINDRAVMALVPHEALAVLAAEFGLDEIADAIRANMREVADENGVDGDDIDDVIDDAAAWIVDAAHAASELGARIDARARRRERQLAAAVAKASAQ